MRSANCAVRSASYAVAVAAVVVVATCVVVVATAVVAAAFSLSVGLPLRRDPVSTLARPRAPMPEPSWRTPRARPGQGGTRPRYGTVPASFRCGRAVDGGLLERTAAPPSAPPPGPGASFVVSTSAPGAAPYATASPARFSMTAGSRRCPPACDLLSAGALGSGCCCPLSNNLRRPR